MFLKNYTSEVPARNSLVRIEDALVKCGVRPRSEKENANHGWRLGW
jgi:hypothetical protein